jgi:hypothetical protein
MDIIGFLCVSLDSSAVQLHDSPVSRCACTSSKAGLNSQNGDSAWWVYYKIWRSVVRYILEKWVNASGIHKETFPVYGGTSFHVKHLTTGSRNSHKNIRKSQMMPDQVRQERKWLRRQSKNFYASGFEAMVKQREKCTDVGRRYVEKLMFFHVWISHVLWFISISDLFTDSPSYYYEYTDRDKIILWRIYGMHK